MLTIQDLGLTAAQQAEVEQTDPAIVNSWLLAVSQSNVRKPVAFFLVGIRSGEPFQPLLSDDGERAKRVAIGERWIGNVGWLFDRESEVLDELFDKSASLLRPWRGDEALRRRFVELWLVGREEEP